ncbi:aminomethyl-transferring glycine dehydrogenase subunit GcvPA [bacterium]|nr:MAG: aminomethyl-transferring glycine dehydrogenase subunit GcvPA [bacterium]
MSHYIPKNDTNEKEILDSLEISDFEELVSIIPKNLRVKNTILGLNPGISEHELIEYIDTLTLKDKQTSKSLCFSGGGVYDHFIPKVIDFISSRSEFNTSYTPYQPEVSQGTLQYIYEFQSMICELSGLDISNASLYDGASAMAEACSLSLSHTRNKKILISSTVNPVYVDVVKTYLKYRGAEIEILPSMEGVTDIEKVSKINMDDVACVVIQSPNYYGYIEDWKKYSNLLKDYKGLLVASSDPISLSILESPGESNADIYVGEGQSLGNYLSYGGPYLGLFSIKENLKRKLPGRVVGMTTDVNDKDGFVLTLQTREQHIRRSKATSNICTNQGLLALRAVIYMSLLGKEGLPSLAKLCFNKAQYAAKLISQIDGFDLFHKRTDFVKEFTVKTKFSAFKLHAKSEQKGILFDYVDENLIKFSFTEKRSKKDIDDLVEFLTSYNE